MRKLLLAPAAAVAALLLLSGCTPGEETEPTPTPTVTTLTPEELATIAPTPAIPEADGAAELSAEWTASGLPAPVGVGRYALSVTPPVMEEGGIAMPMPETFVTTLGSLDELVKWQQDAEAAGWETVVAKVSAGSTATYVLGKDGFTVQVTAVPLTAGAFSATYDFVAPIMAE